MTEHDQLVQVWEQISISVDVTHAKTSPGQPTAKLLIFFELGNNSSLSLQYTAQTWQFLIILNPPAYVSTIYLAENDPSAGGTVVTEIRAPHSSELCCLTLQALTHDLHQHQGASTGLPRSEGEAARCTPFRILAVQKGEAKLAP